MTSDRSDYLRKCFQEKPIRVGGRGEHDGCPVKAEAWRGCCGTPAWGPVAVGVVTKIHQRCHSLIGGGTEKEILWPLSLPSTFDFLLASPLSVAP